MLRTSRRGLADMIVMIVMIVLLLGVSALAFFAYDKQKSESLYLARMKNMPVRQKIEHDATRAKYADVSARIGFKGDGDFSSPEAIGHMLRQGGAAVAEFYAVTAANPDTKGEVEGTVQRKVKFTVNGKEETVDVWQVDKGVTRNAAKVYEVQESNLNLYNAIGRQDDLISQLAGSHNVKVRAQRVKQRDFKDLAATERKTQSDAEYANVEGQIETSNRDLATKAGDLARKEGDLATAQKNELTAYLSLDSAEMRARTESAFAKLKDTALARKRAVDAQKEYRIKSEKRRYDDSRDTDGFVFLVDQRSGYLYVNIGQREDVRVNQSFQVVRADAARAGLVQVAEIRVKAVLQGNIARCGVDALDDPKMYPQAGDMIRNPNFSKRQYQTFALAGKFGGQHSQHTRQELVDMLLRYGFHVVTKIDGATDAVIIGGDWTDDAEFARAKSMQYSFETYTETDVLYFLGLAGPDPRR